MNNIFMNRILQCCLIFGISQSISAGLVDDALSNSSRSETDRALDDKRKPSQVLAFFEIKPGMKVMDVFGGGDYYTEIMSYVVGEKGSVILYNNDLWDKFVTTQVTTRLADNRLPNVQAKVFEPAKLTDLDDQYDAIVFFLGMHDAYHIDEAQGWPEIDTGDFIANLYRLLKPGAIFGVIDHNAVAGSDPAIAGKSLHRIDPAVIIRDVTAAGFTFEAEADFLHNPDVDLRSSVFDKAIRWQSDRSVLKFRK